MSETEKMQRLHLLAAQGHKLSDEDSLKLKKWYETLDLQESVINRSNRPIDLDSQREKIEKTTEKIIETGNLIAGLLRQNEQIRLENRQLRQKIKSRLAEQTV